MTKAMNKRGNGMKKILYIALILGSYSGYAVAVDDIQDPEQQADIAQGQKEVEIAGRRRPIRVVHAGLPRPVKVRAPYVRPVRDISYRGPRVYGRPGRYRYRYVEPTFPRYRYTYEVPTYYSDYNDYDYYGPRYVYRSPRYAYDGYYPRAGAVGSLIHGIGDIFDAVLP